MKKMTVLSLILAVILASCSNSLWYSADQDSDLTLVLSLPGQSASARSLSLHGVSVYAEITDMTTPVPDSVLLTGAAADGSWQTDGNVSRAAVQVQVNVSGTSVKIGFDGVPTDRNLWIRVFQFEDSTIDTALSGKTILNQTKSNDNGEWQLLTAETLQANNIRLSLSPPAGKLNKQTTAVNPGNSAASVSWTDPSDTEKWPEPGETQFSQISLDMKTGAVNEPKNFIPDPQLVMGYTIEMDANAPVPGIANLYDSDGHEIKPLVTEDSAQETARNGDSATRTIRSYAFAAASLDGRNVANVQPGTNADYYMGVTLFTDINKEQVTSFKIYTFPLVGNVDITINSETKAVTIGELDFDFPEELVKPDDFEYKLMFFQDSDADALTSLGNNRYDIDSMKNGFALSETVPDWKSDVADTYNLTTPPEGKGGRFVAAVLARPAGTQGEGFLIAVGNKPWPGEEEGERLTVSPGNFSPVADFASNHQSPAMNLIRYSPISFSADPSIPNPGLVLGYVAEKVTGTDSPVAVDLYTAGKSDEMEKVTGYSVYNKSDTTICSYTVITPEAGKDYYMGVEQFSEIAEGNLDVYAFPLIGDLDSDADDLQSLNIEIDPATKAVTLGELGFGFPADLIESTDFEYNVRFFQDRDPDTFGAGDVYDSDTLSRFEKDDIVKDWTSVSGNSYNFSQDQTPAKGGGVFAAVVTARFTEDDDSTEYVITGGHTEWPEYPGTALAAVPGDFDPSDGANHLPGGTGSGKFRYSPVSLNNEGSKVSVPVLVAGYVAKGFSNNPSVTVNLYDNNKEPVENIIFPLTKENDSIRSYTIIEPGNSTDFQMGVTRGLDTDAVSGGTVDFYAFPLADDINVSIDAETEAVTVDGLNFTFFGELIKKADFQYKVQLSYNSTEAILQDWTGINGSLNSQYTHTVSDAAEGDVLTAQVTARARFGEAEFIIAAGQAEWPEAPVVIDNTPGQNVSAAPGSFNTLSDFDTDHKPEQVGKTRLSPVTMDLSGSSLLASLAPSLGLVVGSVVSDDSVSVDLFNSNDEKESNTFASGTRRYTIVNAPLTDRENSDYSMGVTLNSASTANVEAYVFPLLAENDLIVSVSGKKVSVSGLAFNFPGKLISADDFEYKTEFFIYDQSTANLTTHLGSDLFNIPAMRVGGTKAADFSIIARDWGSDGNVTDYDLSSLEKQDNYRTLVATVSVRIKGSTEEFLVASSAFTALPK